LRQRVPVNRKQSLNGAKPTKSHVRKEGLIVPDPARITENGSRIYLPQKNPETEICDTRPKPSDKSKRVRHLLRNIKRRQQRRAEIALQILKDQQELDEIREREHENE
jgi:hypothetical protein